MEQSQSLLTRLEIADVKYRVLKTAWASIVRPKPFVRSRLLAGFKAGFEAETILKVQKSS